jgi:hypothetical protein
MPKTHAGEKLRGEDIRGYVTTARLLADQVLDTTGSAAQVAAGGLALELLPGITVNGVRTTAKYALDGWLYWYSNPTADIRFTFGTPTLNTGLDGFYACISPYLDAAPVAGAERINYGNFGVVATSGDIGGAGDDTSTSIYACGMLRGYITLTPEAAGRVQLFWSQLVSDAVNTVLRAGSWIRATRLDLT